MEETDQAVLDQATHSWLEASSKLGVKVIAPYSLTAGGKSLNCLAFLQDFGGPKGMVIAALTSPALLSDPHLREAARQKGLFCSSIDPRGWVRYDETAFKEALEDWGYFGPANRRPAWLQMK